MKLIILTASPSVLTIPVVRGFKILLIGVAVSLCTSVFAWRKPTKTERLLIGKRIWQNESRKQTKYLVSWNPYEPFMSLGIGHAIWIPQGVDVPFQSTFPLLLEKLRIAGFNISFLKGNKLHCPWKNRAEFLAAKAANDQRIAKLQTMLEQSIAIQADFIIEQTDRALRKIISLASPTQAKNMTAYLNALLSNPLGWYIVADYTNWRGTGLNRNECAVGYCWGTEYVLKDIISHPNRHDPISRFIQSATKLIMHACAQKESLNKWLKGWMKRLDTYKHTEGLSS